MFRVEAATDVDNLAARRAADQAGFTHEGTIRGGQLRNGQRAAISPATASYAATWSHLRRYWCATEANHDLQLWVKNLFDPYGILNPGKAL